MPSAGRKVGLMRALERYFKVYPCGLPPQESAACCLAGKGRYVDLPRADQPVEFGKALLSAIERIGINVVLPVRNEDMMLLELLRSKIERLGAKLILSPSVTIAICLDKIKLAAKLEKHDYSVPPTMSPDQWRDEVNAYPAFAKARYGSGSRLAQIVRTPEELGALSFRHEDIVVQPVLDGQEYTADMFFDQYGKKIQTVVRKRLSASQGQMDIGEIAPLGEVPPEIERFGTSWLGFVGPINVQFFVKDGKYWITDVNPRFSGGIGLTITSGADFAAYLLEMVTGAPIMFREPVVGTRAMSYIEYVYGAKP